MNLCIAIPTYNRAARLDRALSDLLGHVLDSNCKKNISVFVSNNGSTDSTSSVIADYQKKFQLHDIEYAFENIERNKGLDANIINCYQRSPDGYMWLLSDDDNILNGAIDKVYADIIKTRASFLFYNFDQSPYDVHNPYIKESQLFKSLSTKNVDFIRKVFLNPKITSFIFLKNQKVTLKLKKIFPNLLMANHSYMHCALTLQTLVHGGGFYLSSFFVANSDDDYENHIDFPPYVGGELNEICKEILETSGKLDLIKFFQFEVPDPFITSLNTLATFYKGKIVLTPELKKELIGKTRQEFIFSLKTKGPAFFLSFSLIFLLTKVTIFKFTNFLFMKFTGVSIAKEKDRSNSYET